MSGPRQIAFVVNPRSQGGALARVWPELQRTARRELGGLEAMMTEAPGDATRLARQALQAGADLVVAVGGDGTLHEVAAGFFDDKGAPVRPGAAIGLLPFGTGGDFRKTARVPRDTEAALRLLATGEARPIDVGHLIYRDGSGADASTIFVNITSFGIGGLVDRNVATTTRALGGKMSYFLATTKAMMGWKNQRVRVIFDGDEADFWEVAIRSIAVCNGRYFGGGMQVAPGAELDDGQFDVVCLGDMGQLEFMGLSRHIYDGSHLTRANVKARRARTVEARLLDEHGECLLDVDGEAPGALPARFAILPRALPFVLPPP